MFINDYPPVGPQAPAVEEQVGGFYRRRRASGIGKVICYTPLHNTSLAEMPVPTIVPVVKCWQEQNCEIGGGHIINPTTPEEKAQELWKAEAVHYKSKY